jgi:hypothetical protein
MGMAGTKEALTFKKARSATLGTEYANELQRHFR